MIVYIDCTGFFGYQVVKFVVNLPFQLVYWPLFGVISFFYMPWLIVWGAAAWAPVIYFFWYLFRDRSKG